MGRCFSRYRFDDAIACLSPASDVIQRTVPRRRMLPEHRGRHGSCAGSREGCASRTRVMRFFADESSPGPSGFADNPPGARYLKPTSPASAKFCQPEGPRVRSLLPPAASLYANFRGGLDHLHAADLFNRKRRSRAGSETISPSWLLPSAGPATACRTDVCVSLHIGEVFHSNIGSDERLDFPVVARLSTRSRASRRCASR